MATAEDLWGARSKDARALTDMILAGKKPKKTKTKSVDLGAGTSSFAELDDEFKQEWFEKPVVKGIIDAISVGTYISAASANAGALAIGDGIEEFRKSGDVGKAAGAAGGKLLDEHVNHNPVVMGVKAGFGGDNDSRRLFHDVIKTVQTESGGEKYANTDEAKTVQGVGGFVGDVLLDPINAIPMVIPAKMAGGAIRGASQGAKAAKDIKNGGEALGRTVGRFAGMKQGAKEGRAAAKQAKADDLALRIAKRDINYRGVKPETVRENIPGFQHLPEDVIAGARRISGKDIRIAGRTEAKNQKAAKVAAQATAKALDDDTATEVQKLADSEELTYVQTPEDIAREAVRANTEFMTGKMSVGKHNAILRTLRGTAKTFGHDYDKIVDDYLVGQGLKAPTEKADEVIPPSVGKVNSVPETPVAKVGEEISPEIAKAQEVKARLENPESITPAYNYVDNPGSVNAAEFLKDTPVDEFVKGTAHLTADVPRMTAKTQNSLKGMLQSHPSAQRTVVKEAVLNAGEIRKFLASGSLRQSAKNPEKVITNFRGRFADGTPKGGLGAIERDKVVELIENVAKKNEQAINRLRAAGDEDGAMALFNESVTKVLKGKIFADDLNKLVATVKGGIVSPEVVEFAWTGAKVTPKQLKESGFKGDLREAMKTIKEFGSNLDKLSRKSGAFRDILDAYRNGKLPVDDMARFEEFASTFFKLEGTDRLNKDRILEMASDFLAKNSDAIVASSILHAPLAQSGRLTGLLGGGTGEAQGLIRILPPETIQTYSRPFREQERIQMVEAMAQRAEADIINGISPEFVAKAADDLIDRHFSEYSTKSGEFTTKDGWHTSTMNLNDGLPKKEFFWTTHSAIDLFTKLNQSMSAFMKNIPELDEIRHLAKTKPTAANRKNYETAYRNVKDNLSMRTLAQIDVNLKAHNVFGYLTNTMPLGDTAIRLSLYDVLNAIGPELRMKHLWVPQHDINNFMPTQIMDVAETLIRSLKGADATGEINYAQMLKNSQEIMKGNFSKNANAAGIVKFIESNLDNKVMGFNAEIVAKNLKTTPKAEVIRRTKYTQFINSVMNKVGDDGLTPLQKLAETTLRNTAMHGSQFSTKIVYATQEQMKRLGQALEFGTVGNFSDVVSSIVRPDKFEPEVSKVFAQEIRAEKLKHVSPDELAVAEEMANVAKLSTGKEIVLWTSKEMEPWLRKTPTETKPYSIPVGPKPQTGKYRLPLSTANAEEIMLNGMRMLTDGSPVASKWSTKKWVSKEKEAFQRTVNAANAKVAGRVSDTRLHPDIIAETAAKMDDEEIVNLYRQELAHDVSRRMFVGQQMWNVRFGKEISYDAVTSGTHLGTALETAFHASINEFAKKYTPAQVNQAFKDIQATNVNIHELVARGAIDGLDPATIDMAKLTGIVFDSSTNNFYVRNGVGPDLMNSILNSMTHVNEKWRFPTMVDGKITTPMQMSQVWKTWTNIENPFKALAAMHTAMIKASTDISMAARYSNTFGMQKPPVGEMANWAKIDVSRVDNRFVDLIDTDLYYPKQVIAELPELGRFITASRTFENEKFQQWVNSFDEFTSALKLTQTVMKPGHHVMSTVGDFFRNRLAGVTSMGPVKDSWRIIRSRNVADKGMSELDKYARIKDGSLEMSIQTKTSGKGTKLIIGGKPVIIDDSQMYDLYSQRGIFLPPHNAGVAEDLIAPAHAGSFDHLPGGRIANTVSKAASGTNNFVSGLINNKVIKMNSFTSQRDNLFRGELAVHFMKSKNFKSVEEALDFAEIQVRKWAPTAKDLTAMESKYNRRIFLYYTWLRGAIPRVVEGLVTRPGVALAPSKAMYNLAVANGLNPNSIGDPFDPNQLLPDYYRNGVLGPQWSDPNSGHLWGFNPTAPVIDVFNSVGAGSSLAGLNPGAENNNYERIGRLLMGMTNPIFRSPVELAIGRNVGTGAPIEDGFQYALDMPGPLRYASKITGHTINPMEGGIPRRTEAKFEDGIGTPDEWWKNAALETANYVGGMQVRDYTSESAMKSAEYQEKEKERAEKDSSTRQDWWK